MSLLLYGEIRPCTDMPDFGSEFRAHMEAKKHPKALAGSRYVWNLLATGLRQLGMKVLPEVVFSDLGKPSFRECDLHFSLSHSGKIAAVLISEKPCGVDVELVRAEIGEKLRERVLSREEADCDFFAVWTKKEAAGKISGKGIPSRPRKMDLSEYAKMNMMQKRIYDSLGQEYALCAICEDAIDERTDCV